MGAGQPQASYTEFKREILGEIGRCLQIPVNILIGDSSRHNYASGRLDHQTYFKSLRIEQADLGLRVMTPIFAAWLKEARLVMPELATVIGGTPLEDPTSHGWIWTSEFHVDPSKESKAQAQRLANFTTSLATEYARIGKDWETEIRQIARERNLISDLGLVVASPEQPTEDDEEEDDDDDPDLPDDDRDGSGTGSQR